MSSHTNWETPGEGKAWFKCLNRQYRRKLVANTAVQRAVRSIEQRMDASKKAYNIRHAMNMPRRLTIVTMDGEHIPNIHLPLYSTIQQLKREIKKQFPAFINERLEITMDTNTSLQNHLKLRFYNISENTLLRVSILPPEEAVELGFCPQFLRRAYEHDCDFIKNMKYIHEDMEHPELAHRLEELKNELYSVNYNYFVRCFRVNFARHYHNNCNCFFCIAVLCEDGNN